MVISPFVTIFTSCYNQSRFLPQAIESVLGQTFGDFELLLYDDGSEDDTAEVMRKYACQDHRVRVMKSQMPREGVGALVNHSIENARGYVWVWCPADDVLLPDCLAIKMSQSAIRLHNAVLYSHWELIDESGDVYSTIRPQDMSPEQFRQRIWNECPIGFTGIWIPKHIFSRVGGFPTDMQYSEDYAWMLRAAGMGIDFRCVPEVLYQKRHHADRTTARHSQDITTNIDAIRERVRRELKHDTG